jgi:hypothetical protein
MIDLMECPYCEYSFEHEHDDGSVGDRFEIECPICEKIFQYSIVTICCFDTNKANCLNGGEHDWEPVRGIPSELLVGIDRCKICGRKRIDRDKNEASKKEWLKKWELK